MKNTKMTIATTALILLLTFAALMAGISAVTAEKIITYSGISVQPKIVGLGESITVNAYITPQPESTRKVYEGVYFVFTKPDGTTVTEGPVTTEFGPNEGAGTGTCWFTYIPDKIGDWSVKLTWAGDDTHEGTESEAFKFTVQSEPLPLTPSVPLPTGFWERPISAENIEWYQISGGWYYSDKTANYNASGTSFNPYTKAPETAHILWTHQPYIGGLVGGDYGGAYHGSAYYSAHYYPTPFTVIMGGRAYYVSDDGIHCLDERTGEELWTPAVPIPGTSPGGTSMSYTAALWAVPEYTTYANRETGQEVLTTPVLWTISGRQIVGEEAIAAAITKYDASRGTVLMILTPPVDQSFGKTYFVPSEHAAYTQMSVTYPNGTKGTRLVKWDTIGTQRNFTERTIWDVPAPKNWNWYMGIWGDVLISARAWGNAPCGLTGVSATTGELLWDNQTLGDIVLNCPGTLAYGKVYYSDSLHRTIHAFDILTGREIWESDPREYPWGAFTAYNEGAAYGKVYMQSYDGYIYAYDAETGKTVWKFYSGDTTETPYGTRPFWSGIAIADGKVYAGTSEHSPTPPFMRGCRLYCLDANTGDELWSIAFANGGDKSIADGTLIASNEYDSTMYAFDKGQTATTVTASPKVSARGSSVLIEGTILDQSPAQPGTPAVSDASMSAWMEYLHMQKPKPEDVTGVTAELRVVHPDGHVEWIYTVTTDEYGNYAHIYNPPTEGVYKIIATFTGSASYWSSSEETTIGVTEASSAAQLIESEQPAHSEQLAEALLTIDITTEQIIVTVVAVVIVIAAVSFYLLRRRRIK